VRRPVVDAVEEVRDPGTPHGHREDRLVVDRLIRRSVPEIEPLELPLLGELGRALACLAADGDRFDAALLKLARSALTDESQR
jgi:hypothetical protein